MNYGVYVVVVCADGVIVTATSGGDRDCVSRFVSELSTRYSLRMSLPAEIVGLHEAVAASGTVVRAFIAARGDNAGDPHALELAFRQGAYAWSVAPERIPTDRLPEDIKSKLPQGGRQ